jgi:hypothetical protein
MNVVRAIAVCAAVCTVGCLGKYSPPSTGAGSTSSGNPQPAPAPASSGDPQPDPPAPPAVDAGTKPPAPADAGAPPQVDAALPATSATPSCDALLDCCNQLPPDDAAQCMDSLSGATEAICQAILDGLQQNGLCL